MIAWFSVADGLRLGARPFPAGCYAEESAYRKIVSGTFRVLPILGHGWPPAAADERRLTPRAGLHPSFHRFPPIRRESGISGPARPTDSNMAIRKRFPDSRAVQQLHDLVVTLKGFQSAKLVYERLFTAADRRRVPEEEIGQRHIVNVWAELRNLSLDRAALEIGRKLDMLTPATYDWLLRELGEQGPAAGAADYPAWDRDRRTLSFKGEVVRSIRSVTVAKHVTTILDAFENRGWPRRIDDPLPGYADKQRLREAVANLNVGLTGIRFYSDGSGKGIIWQPR
jgi:hypothetical protein